MTEKIPTGRIQNLSKDQELCLKQVWAHLLQFWAVPVNVSLVLTEDNSPELSDTTEANEHVSNSTEGKRKKLRGFFGRKDKGTFNPKKSASSSTVSSTVTPEGELVDGYSNDTNTLPSPSLTPGCDIHESLKDLDSEEVQEYFWKTLKCDYPDNLLLRFVRARKWDTEKAMSMIGNTLRWRLKEGDPESIIRGGEAAVYQKGKKGVIKQLELSKATVRGYDLNGNPIVYLRPRLHHSSDQSEEDMHEYSLLIIEQARLFLKEPRDAATILFDLSGFAINNMDYAPVKFLISCFEAHYPECLGKLIIHKAPWIFPPIWNIIKNWLDPVVASKIVFTSTTKDLEQIVPSEHIPADLGGMDTYNFDDFKPIDGSADTKLKDVETRNTLLEQRKEIIGRFIKATLAWIESKTEAESSEWLSKKIEISKELVENYVELDPYVRSRSFYDLNGTLKLGH